MSNMFRFFRKYWLTTSHCNNRLKKSAHFVLYFSMPKSRLRATLTQPDKPTFRNLPNRIFSTVRGNFITILTFILRLRVQEKDCYLIDY